MVIGQGTYLLNRPLQLDKPNLKVIGVTGERVILVGREDLPAVVIIQGSGVLLQDLAIQGGFYGIKIDMEANKPTRGVTIRNCHIGSTGADCIKSYAADNLLVEYCQIGPSGGRQADNAEGIDVVASVGVIIRGCIIEETSTNGVYLKGGTRDGIVERCLVRRTGHGRILLGQDTDLEYMRDHAANEAINCIARNNIVVDTQTAGLGTYSGKNISFVNNTLVNVARSGQAALWVVTNGRGVPAEHVIFKNNIVVLGSDRPLLFIKDADGLPDSDYNLFHAAGPVKIVREVSVDASFNRKWTLAQWQQAAGVDKHSKEADPRLDSRKYRPLENSPALGAGTPIAGVEDDYGGARRAQSGIWDIGACLVTGNRSPQ